MKSLSLCLIIFAIFLLHAGQSFAQETPACLSFRGCLKLTLDPELFGLPPTGNCLRLLTFTDSDGVSDLSVLNDEADATEKPKNPAIKKFKLVLFAVGLAPLEFFVSTAIHEGAHAAGIILFKNATLEGYKPWPHKTPSGNFVFGATYWNGNLTPTENAIVTAAPMFADTAILGAYSALTATGAVPKNKFARLGLWVFAAGHWVDMANHLAARNEFTDSRKLMRYLESEHGFSSTGATVFVKGTQATVLATSGYFMTKELIKIFKDEPEKVRPKRELSSSKAFDFQDIYILPSTDGSQTGLVLGGRF